MLALERWTLDLSFLISAPTTGVSSWMREVLPYATLESSVVAVAAVGPT